MQRMAETNLLHRGCPVSACFRCPNRFRRNKAESSVVGQCNHISNFVFYCLHLIGGNSEFAYVERPNTELICLAVPFFYCFSCNLCSYMVAKRGFYQFVVFLVFGYSCSSVSLYLINGMPEDFYPCFTLKNK